MAGDQVQEGDFSLYSFIFLSMFIGTHIFFM